MLSMGLEVGHSDDKLGMVKLASESYPSYLMVLEALRAFSFLIIFRFIGGNIGSIW